MMEIAYPCLLALLEMTCVFAALLLLHGFRKLIGGEAFYLALGLLFVFTQIAGSVGLRLVTDIPGFNFNFMSIGLLLPVFAALMIIYVSDGTLAAQRVIIGMIAALFLYFYLAMLTAGQADASESITGSDASQNLKLFSSMLTSGVHDMAASVISFTIDIFLIPIFYQSLRNWKCRLFFAVAGALLLVQLIDSSIYSIIFFLGNPNWWRELTYTLFAKFAATLWLSIIATYYLARTEREKSLSGRGALDIVMAFFGNYNRARALEENLRRSEERYRLLFRSAGEMILSTAADGAILDANRAAFNMTGLKSGELEKGLHFDTLTGVDPAHWVSGEPDREQLPVSAIMPRTGRRVELNIASFRTAPDAEPGFIVFGRDVTERTRLEKEMEDWRIRSFHNQRLESIGRLAGGIAHDFNNYLHSIQGHLDIIHYMHPVEDKDVERHLEKIDMITGKASLLTRQMLGFARKGNYAETEFDPAGLIRSTLELFTPDTADFSVAIDCSHVPEKSAFQLHGDVIQIQQALLNILLNARDAVRENPEGRHAVSIVLAAEKDLPDFRRDVPGEAAPDPAASYCVIRISDSGPGIPDSVRTRIFEPFFTTKPTGQGTGMGLSMAYGTMLTHKGWLQCHNDASSGGAVFELVFPILAD